MKKVVNLPKENTDTKGDTIANEAEELKCDKCDKTFQTKYKMRYHFKTVHGNPVTCEICGLLTSKHNLGMHRAKVHHLYNIPKAKLVKKCDSCDTEFKSGEEMDNHLNTCQSSEKQFKCKDCDKIWVSHLSLELHYVESHKKIMFCCDICGLASSEQAQIKRHKKWVHEKKYDHVCHICGKPFTKPGLLAQHLAANHDIGEAKFKCDFCDKIFEESCKLWHHMEGVHLRNVKYNCDQCSYSGFTQRAFRDHQRKIHPKKK